MGMVVLLAPVLRYVSLLLARHDVKMLEGLLCLFVKRLYIQTIKMRPLSTFWSLSVR